MALLFFVIFLDLKFFKKITKRKSKSISIFCSLWFLVLEIMGSVLNSHLWHLLSLIIMFFHLFPSFTVHFMFLGLRPSHKKKNHFMCFAYFSFRYIRYIRFLTQFNMNVGIMGDRPSLTWDS